jgi:hypothetical protein
MNIEVKILRNEHGKPADKLADVEIHFVSGELEGLKLVGFAIWRRREGPGLSVTFPARQFIVHGDRRNFALLRGISDPAAQNRVRELVLRAYTEHEHHVAEIAS